MEESRHSSRTAAEILMKEACLQALKSNDFKTLQELLDEKKIDIDTVFEVEDKNLVLASYRKGYWLPSYKLKCSWATGLHIAVMLGHVECLMVLLDHQATINCRPNGKTPLHVACEVANVECLNILLNHGAKLNCFTLSGHTPLHLCTTEESVPCAKELVWRVTAHSDETTILAKPTAMVKIKSVIIFVEPCSLDRGMEMTQRYEAKRLPVLLPPVYCCHLIVTSLFVHLYPV